MRLDEIFGFDRAERLGLYVPEQDILGQRDDTRRQPVTLRILKILKRARAERRRIDAERAPWLAGQYGLPDEDAPNLADEKGALELENKRLQVAKSEIDLRKKKVDLAIRE